MKITPIPALSDNYIWLIEKERQVIIVDPAQAVTLIDYFAKNSLNPTAILLTHHHADHTDGVAQLVAKYPDIQVYGSQEVAQFANHIMRPNDKFELLNMPIQIILSNGHTEQHISYLVDNQYLFCGDSLFSAGCGRTFTGDYQVHFETMQRFNQLPETVKIYPAHEYTQANLKFVESVEPNNLAVKEYSAKVDQLRSQHQPTLPSTIKIERKINPFLTVKTVEEFTKLRKGKDCF